LQEKSDLQKKDDVLIHTALKKESIKVDVPPELCKKNPDVDLPTMILWIVEYAWTVDQTDVYDLTLKLVTRLEMHISQVIHAVSYFQSLHLMPSIVAEEQKNKKKEFGGPWVGWWIQCLVLAHKYLDEAHGAQGPDHVFQTALQCLGYDSTDNRRGMMAQELRLLDALEWKLDMRPLNYLHSWALIRPDKFFI
jgi:hypothetical protein